LSEFGTISSSETDVVPAPNWICSDPEFTNLVAKRLCTFSSLSKYGASPTF